MQKQLLWGDRQFGKECILNTKIIPQFCSSLLSGQSRRRSHTREAGMQRPLDTQVNSSDKHAVTNKHCPQFLNDKGFIGTNKQNAWIHFIFYMVEAKLFLLTVILVQICMLMILSNCCCDLMWLKAMVEVELFLLTVTPLMLQLPSSPALSFSWDCKCITTLK